MTKIYPKDWVEPVVSEPLEINEKKKKEMIKKAKELFSEPIEEGALADRLEQHYVEKNEHYTSAQLKEVVDAVAEELKPVVEAPALEIEAGILIK